MTNRFDISCHREFHVIIRRDDSLRNLGGVSYLLQGHLVGDLMRTGDLRVPLDYWRSYVTAPRNLEIVQNMSASEAWNFIDRHLYSSDAEKIGEDVSVAIDIASNYCESFDGFPVFLVTEFRFERFIWSADRGNTANELRLPLGTYQSTINKVIEILSFLD